MEQQMDSAVIDRYSKGAKQQEPALCCPVNYDPQFLKVIPEEILKKDYGCGDPTPYVRKGDTVLDLGSGGGKACYIASQKVGAEGKVVGVDMNEDMLRLARKYQQEIADRIGYDNVTFHKGKIQDLALDVRKLNTFLGANPINKATDLIALEAFIAEQKKSAPFIADNSIDCIVSNCVLNLVNEDEKQHLFKEIFRVLKRGGHVAISDIVCDEPVPAEMKADPELWSGCISGAMTEQGFLKAFADVGFYGIHLEKREAQPWQTVEGIEFRSVTVTASKGKEGPCWDRHHAVVYRGPFSEIKDDDGHTYMRGERMAVCEKTFNILRSSTYSDHFYFVEPLTEVPAKQAKAFGCDTPMIRSPKVTKGKDYSTTQGPSASGCC